MAHYQLGSAYTTVAEATANLQAALENYDFSVSEIENGLDIKVNSADDIHVSVTFSNEGSRLYTYIDVYDYEGTATQFSTSGYEANTYMDVLELEDEGAMFGFRNSDTQTYNDMYFALVDGETSKIVAKDTSTTIIKIYMNDATFSLNNNTFSPLYISPDAIQFVKAYDNSMERFIDDVYIATVRKSMPAGEVALARLGTRYFYLVMLASSGTNLAIGLECTDKFGV